MATVIPFEYCANVTDIINYIECSGVSWKGNSWQLFHFSQAFKNSDAPKSNLSKPYHSSYVKGQTTNLTLLKAAYRDVALASTSYSHWRCLERASNAKMPDRQEVTGINKLSGTEKQGKIISSISKDHSWYGKISLPENFLLLGKMCNIVSAIFPCIIFYLLVSSNEDFLAFSVEV